MAASAGVEYPHLKTGLVLSGSLAMVVVAALVVRAASRHRRDRE